MASNGCVAIVAKIELIPPLMKMKIEFFLLESVTNKR